MPDEYPQQDQYQSDVSVRLRDLEQKHKLLKDRTLMIGENLVSEREETFNELQELKKTVLKLQQENARMQEFLKQISEHIAGLARKEELMILQRQIEIMNPWEH